jgi:hypothetical protein
MSRFLLWVGNECFEGRGGSELRGTHGPGPKNSSRCSLSTMVIPRSRKASALGRLFRSR